MLHARFSERYAHTLACNVVYTLEQYIWTYVSLKRVKNTYLKHLSNVMTHTYEKYQNPNVSIRLW